MHVDPSVQTDPIPTSTAEFFVSCAPDELDVGAACPSHGDEEQPQQRLCVGHDATREYVGFDHALAGIKEGRIDFRHSVVERLTPRLRMP